MTTHWSFFMDYIKPDYYKDAGGLIEPIDICIQFPFSFGSFLKYVLRAPYKGDEAADLTKALYYWEIACEEYLCDPHFEVQFKRFFYLAKCFENPYCDLILNNGMELNEQVHNLVKSAITSRLLELKNA